jgi:hypothetical protein
MRKIKNMNKSRSEKTGYNRIYRGDTVERKMINKSKRHDRINGKDNIYPCSCGGTKFRSVEKGILVKCRSCNKERSLVHGTPVKETQA